MEVDENVLRWRARPLAQIDVSFESDAGGVVQWDETRLVKLGFADRKPLIGDIMETKRQCFGYPHPSHE
jgi:hypothetical protein